MKGWTHVVDLTLLCSASLILLHPLTYSRGLACLLPGVTLVAEHNVGAHAALPCLVQDWALHGKKMHTSCYLFVREQQECAVLSVSWIEYCYRGLVFPACVLKQILTTQQRLLLHCCLVTEWRVCSDSFEWVFT